LITASEISKDLKFSIEKVESIMQQCIERISQKKAKGRRKNVIR